MVTVTSLLDFLRNLLGDPAERAQFDLDPEEYLREHGFADLDGHDVYDAVGLVCDTLPPSVAQEISSSYRTGGNRVEVNQSGPPPVHTQPHETDLEAAIRQISYVTNNYAYTQIDDRDTIDDRDNIIDNSVNTDIYAKGDVEFDQDIHNENTIASGDGAVAAGDDINGPVATGDDAIAAVDSQVADDGAILVDGDVDDSVLLSGINKGLIANDSDVGAASFGDGDATNFEADDVTVKDGSALGVGSGWAKGEQDNSDNSLDYDLRDNSYRDNSYTDKSVEVEDSFQDNREIEDSFNSDVDVDKSSDDDLIDLKDAVDVKDLVDVKNVKDVVDIDDVTLGIL